MGLVERRLKKVSVRLRRLREELVVLDEQIAHLRDEADDLEVRALVSDWPGSPSEHRDARNHLDAALKHRHHLLAEIADLENTQDELLDRLGGSSA